jgi:hypothetical protein
MYNPFVFKLPKTVLNIKDITIEDNVLLSPVVPYPLFTLGFHSFLHRTRSAMGITKNLQTKIPFYYVVNPFENNISNYEDDINNSNKIYLKTTNDYSNEFNQLWEVLFIFDITKNNDTIQIIGDSDKISFSEDSIKLFKQKTNKTTLLTKDKFVKGADIKNNSCNLIIAYINSKSISDLNFIEQETYLDLLKIIINILKNTADKGNVVLQLYDTLTITSLKMIYILQAFFEDAIIYKPFLSRDSDSDKFLILRNFKPKYDIIKQLESVAKQINNNSYMSDIFPELVLPKEYLNTFKFINIKLVNNQQIMINEIIKYIKGNNYFGDKYHLFRNKQIECSKWWITNFYPPSVNLYEKNKETLDKFYKTSQDKLLLEFQRFITELIN